MSIGNYAVRVGSSFPDEVKSSSQEIKSLCRASREVDPDMLKISFLMESRVAEEENLRKARVFPIKRQSPVKELFYQDQTPTLEQESPTPQAVERRESSSPIKVKPPSSPKTSLEQVFDPPPPFV